MHSIRNVLDILKQAAAGITAALLILAAGNVTASYGQDADVNIDAEVLQSLSITTDQNVDFGEILPGGTHTIDPETDETERGELSITGEDGEDILIDILPSDDVTLSDNDGNELTFTSNLIGHESDAPGSATEIVSGEAETLSSGGDFYLWLGGDLEVPSDASSGSYSGEATISVEYDI